MRLQLKSILQATALHWSPIFCQGLMYFKLPFTFTINFLWFEFCIALKKEFSFLARATEGTSLYVWVRQLVSQLVSVFLFFKTENWKDDISMQRRLGQIFTCILEWGQGTCKKSKPSPAWAYTNLVVLVSCSMYWPWHL